MAKKLVIVESPSKAKTINKFLGRNYTVKASNGHIRDLPRKTLGVDVENDFTPEYQRIRGKGSIIKELQKLAKNVDAIYLAADPDREGEAICWHLAHELQSAKKPIYRVTYNEVTKTAIVDALKNPREIDQALVDAQQARRVLDRLVGYQISPILWRSVRPGLSAGRVQSVAVRLICEREVEIENFKPIEYWTITADLTNSDQETFQAKLLQIDSQKGTLRTYGFEIDETRAKEIVEDAKTKNFVVKSIKKRQQKRRPVPPFITSTLQQEASRKLSFSARRTMTIAQQLYEGLEIGSEGSIGLITYMRTDSTRIADEALDDVRNFIKDQYGTDYLPAKPTHYKTKKKAQDAHEAIRPTLTDRTPQSLQSFLTKEQFNLYNLIWKRFVACQMKPAILDVTTTDIDAKPYLFRSTGSLIKFDGFMKVYLEGKDDINSSKDDNQIMPKLSEGEQLDLKKIAERQHFTQPPPRYSEATLVKALEEKGIGRPSTYAAIISTIQDRKYAEKDQRRFVPTDVGRLVNEMLIGGFPEILDVEFTAKMEGRFDRIAEGEIEWTGEMRSFYGPFEKSLEAAPDKMYEARKAMEVESDQICEKCEQPMIIKWGKWGRFLGCSGYPECSNIKPLATNGEAPPEDEPIDQTCEKCSSAMVIKTSRQGDKFIACTGYPKCKNAKPIPIGFDCPKCEKGYIGSRRSRRGKLFYGCSEYPDCDFVVWNAPFAKPCPECGKPFVIDKTTKTKGRHLACYDKECGHTEPYLD